MQKGLETKLVHTLQIYRIIDQTLYLDVLLMNGSLRPLMDQHCVQSILPLVVAAAGTKIAYDKYKTLKGAELSIEDWLKHGMCY